MEGKAGKTLFYQVEGLNKLEMLFKKSFLILFGLCLSYNQILFN